LRARLLPAQLELGLLALYVLAWQAAKVPLQAPRSVAVAHAREWLAFERAHGLAIEHQLSSFAGRTDLGTALLWSYQNLHLATVFASIAAVRLLAPERYPWLRTTFVLLHLPVLAVTGLFPLAPPLALPGLVPARFAAASSGDATAPLSNVTAAAASIHFAWAACVAAAGVLLARRSRLALVLLLYPLWNFLVIVGTGNHFVLDAVVGGACFLAAAGVAALLHRGAAAATPAPGARAARIVAGTALIAYGIEAGSSTIGPHGTAVLATAVTLGALLVAPARLAHRVHVLPR